MHPTPAASRANSTASCGTLRLPRLPAYPSHSPTRSLPWLVYLLPAVTYQPVLSHLSCACAALRCAPNPNPNPIHSLPRYSRVPFFDPAFAELGDCAQKPRKKLPSPSVDRWLAPPILLLPRYSTGRSGSKTPRPCSSSQLPPLPLGFNSTGPHPQAAPLPTHALSRRPRSFVKLCIRPSTHLAYPWCSSSWNSIGDQKHRPGGRTSAPTRPSLASVQA